MKILRCVEDSNGTELWNDNHAVIALDISEDGERIKIWNSHNDGMTYRTLNKSI